MRMQADRDRSGGAAKRVSRIALTLALLVAAFGGLALAQTDRPVRLVLAPESRLWIEGGSNVHDWSCDAGELIAELRVRTRDDLPSDATLPDALDHVTVDVPVAQITCGNGTMEGKLRDALKAEDHAAITFRMDDYAIIPDSADPGKMLVGARGALTVAGVSRPIQLSVLGEDIAGEGIRITGSAQILMTDFGVEPPTAMFGLLRTDDRVLIRFDLTTSYEQIVAGLAAGGWIADDRPRR